MHPVKLALQFVEEHFSIYTEEKTPLLKHVVHPILNHAMKIHPQTEHGRHNLKRIAKKAYDHHDLLFYTYHKLKGR